MNVNEEDHTATGAIGEHRGDPAEHGGAGVPGRGPQPLHYVVVKHGDNGLEVLRVPLGRPLGRKGEALAVFCAGWAARGYLFAEAPGGGWFVKACTLGELVSLLGGSCAGVEWVMLDPRPDRSRGEVANVMPRKNFVDYLLHSRGPLRLRGNDSETIGGEPRGRENDR